MKLILTLLLAIWLGLACTDSDCAESGRLPKGLGLAAKYPGDDGIADDKRVLLAEDFEVENLNELERHWESISNEDGAVLALSSEVPPGSRGSTSLQMTATLGENTGGHLYRRLPREVEQIFARFYVRFAEDAPYVHHYLGGYRSATAWP